MKKLLTILFSILLTINSFITVNVYANDGGNTTDGVAFSIDDDYLFIYYDDQETLNSITRVYFCLTNGSEYSYYELNKSNYCDGYIELPLSDEYTLYRDGLKTYSNKEVVIVAYIDGDFDYNGGSPIASNSFISNKIIFTNVIERVDMQGGKISYSQDDEGNLVIKSDNEDYLQALCKPDLSIYSNEDDVYNHDALPCRSYGYVDLFSSSNGEFIIKNTKDEPNNLVKHNGYVTISKDVLYQKGVINGYYIIHAMACGYYIGIDNVTLNTGIEEYRIPEDLKIEIIDGDITISTNDKKYLERLQGIFIDSHDTINEYSFLRTTGFGDTEHNIFKYDGKKVTISMKDFCDETGAIPIDEGIVRLNIQSRGYEEYDNYNFQISSTCLKEVPEFTYYLDGKYFVVESEDEEWLEALCVPYSNYIGAIMGACVDDTYIKNAGSILNSFSFCNVNWSHYIDGIDVSKSLLKKEGKKVIIDINNGVLNGPANIEYLIKLHAYGYKCSDAFSVTFTDASKLLPSDMAIDFKEGNMIITTNEQEFIDFFETIRFEGNGQNTHIADKSRIIKETGKITVTDIPERYVNGNCYIRIWGSDDSYIVPMYKIYKFTIDYKKLNGSKQPGYFYSGLSTNLSNQIEGLDVEEFELLRKLIGDDNGAGGNEDLTTDVTKMVESMELNEEDRSLFDEQLKESETIGDVFNIYLNFKIKYGEKEIVDDAYVTETEEDIDFEIYSDIISINKNFVIYRLHNGKVSKVPFDSIDYENKKIYFHSNKFSTYILATSDKCVVSFDSMGGSEIDSVFVDKNSLIVKPSTPTYKSYSFVDWYTSSIVQDETTKWNFDTNIVTDNITLYAKWTPITYSITYDLDGGVVSDNPNSYTIETETFTLNNPTKTGYTFIGWSTPDIEDKSTSVTIEKGSSGNRTYKANWSANADTPYKVEHYKQNIDGTYPTETSYVDNLTGTTASEVTPGVKDTTSGDFYGFTAPSTQTVTILADGSSVVKYEYTRNSYNITFNIKGHGSQPDSQSIKYEGKVTKPNDLVEQGYTFDGWYKNEDCLESQEFDFDNETITEDTTLYASWTPITYSITYDLDGGVVSDNPNSYTIETETFTLNNPTKTGYTFVGWSGTDIEEQSAFVTINKGSSGDRTYKANWEIDSGLKTYITIDSSISEGSEIYINGKKTIVGSDNKVLADIDDGYVVTTYDIANSSSDDIHTKYPKSMNVYFVDSEGNANINENYTDILKYAGASIRVTGKKGIRIITSIPTSKKNSLINNSYDGYQVMEYGTIMCWSSDLVNNEEPTIYKDSDGTYKATHGAKGRAYSRSDKLNTIYKEGNGITQYTNTLVGDYSDEQCASDFAMRSYMILKSTSDSKEMIIYGGTLYRSISYVAYQNKNAFAPKTDAYEYIWKLIRAGYGNAYDDEYKG